MLLVTILAIGFILLKISDKDNSFEENSAIQREAIDLKNPEICNKIKGSMQIGNPADLTNPTTINEESARKRCKVIVEWQIKNN